MKDFSNNPVAAAYVAMYEKKVVERAKWVPEEITDEGAAEFMGAAANAAKKGDKTFKFGDKEYKVTMKKDTVDAITKNESTVTEAKKLKDTDLVSRVGAGMGQMDVSAHVRKALKVKDAYFDGTSLVVGDKTVVPGALKDPKMTVKDLVSAAAKKLGIKEEDEVEVCEECGKVHEGACGSGDKKEVEEVAEPEAKGEKDFKDMHTKNTKKSGEKDDGTEIK